MSTGKRYTEEFKIEAVKQITERGYSVQEVAKRLGGNADPSSPIDCAAIIPTA